MSTTHSLTGARHDASTPSLHMPLAGRASHVRLLVRTALVSALIATLATVAVDRRLAADVAPPLAPFASPASVQPVVKSDASVPDAGTALRDHADVPEEMPPTF